MQDLFVCLFTFDCLCFQEGEITKLEQFTHLLFQLGALKPGFGK